MDLRRFLAKNLTIISLSTILLASFGVRIWNLNYNSPFSDEAIYVVVGKLGIFQKDWSTYNPSAWMSGQPLLYPSLTAIAYNTGGIVSSRFINVIFGVLSIEAIFLITTYLLEKSPPKLDPTLKNKKIFASIIAAAILGGSAISLYISRLATLDMPSFYLFILGISFLLKAEKEVETSGKWYFLSSLMFLLSCLTKLVTGIYLPLIIAYSFWNSKKIGKEQHSFYLKYFLPPLLIILLGYFLTTYQSLITYANTQFIREKSDYQTILNTSWEYTKYLWGFWIAGSIGMFIKKDYKMWAILTLSALWIITFHLITKRWFTLDKHLFLTFVFLAPLVGIGISNLVWSIKYKSIKLATALMILLVLVVFWVNSYMYAAKFNNLWNNATPLLNYLEENVKSGDKVLTEVGPPVILTTYNKNFPINTVTFDWFEYRGQIGEKAYKQGVKDRYFEYIQLNKEEKWDKEENIGKLSRLIKTNLSGNYSLIYSEGDYLVYKRAF